jgi:hypothetical protein
MAGGSRRLPIPVPRDEWQYAIPAASPIQDFLLGSAGVHLDMVSWRSTLVV